MGGGGRADSARRTTPRVNSPPPHLDRMCVGRLVEVAVRKGLRVELPQPVRGAQRPVLKRGHRLRVLRRHLPGGRERGDGVGGMCLPAPRTVRKPCPGECLCMEGGGVRHSHTKAESPSLPPARGRSGQVVFLSTRSAESAYPLGRWRGAFQPTLPAGPPADAAPQSSARRAGAPAST